MKSTILLFTLALGAQAQSSGCGSSPPNQPRAGSTSTITISVQGLSRTYRIHRPSSHSASTPAPVVFSFHGWGSSASFNEGYMGLTATSDSNGFFAIYPEGRSDYQRDTNNGWQSFNSVGSTDSVSPNPECTSRTNGYCYTSCQNRQQGCGKCDWTTCADDGLFTAAILDKIESEYCVDTDRIFATGYSNGGMMVYELGMALTSRFAALVPGGGQPFVGHNKPPPVGGSNGLLSVLDLHGTRDSTCPGNSTTSSDGWNYEPVDNVLTVWAEALGCSASRSLRKFDTPEDGGTGLWCVQFGQCPSGVDVVRCSYNLGHQWLGYNSNGGAGARLAWWFFDNHPKVSSSATKNSTAARMIEM